jgi:hypothetical protein
MTITLEKKHFFLLTEGMKTFEIMNDKWFIEEHEIIH